MYAHEVHAREMHAYKMHAHEVHAHRNRKTTSLAICLSGILKPCARECGVRFWKFEDSSTWAQEANDKTPATILRFPKTSACYPGSGRNLHSAVVRNSLRQLHRWQREGDYFLLQ